MVVTVQDLEFSWKFDYWVVDWKVKLQSWEKIGQKNDIFSCKFGDDSDWVYSEHYIHSICVYKVNLCKNSVLDKEEVFCIYF